MRRLHQLWCEARPELNYMSQQQLRNHVAYLRLSAQPHNAEVEDNACYTSILQRRRCPPRRHPSSSPSILRDGFLNAVADAENRTTEVHRKRTVRAEDLAQMNDILDEHLSPASDLWDIDCAVYAAATVLCPKRQSKCVDKVARRIQQLASRMTQVRRETSRIQCVIDVIRENQPPTPKQKSVLKTIRSHYHTTKLSTLLLLKQKLVDKLRALSVTRKRLVNKERWIKENNIFRSNPSRLFKRDLPPSLVSPTVEETEVYWRDVYEKDVVLEDTPMIAQFQEFCDRQLEEPLEVSPVTSTDIRRTLSSTKSYAAPGVDAINSYWWKSFPCVHEHLARIFTEYIRGTKPIPSWLVEGRTVLIPKKGDLSKPQNYRPITCLNTVYKIFTSVLNERILSSIGPVWNQIYEQKGSKRGLAGCKNNLLIDRCICHDAVAYLRNLSMAWVDYAGAFDSTSHPLLLKLLECLKVHPDIVKCIANIMPLWRTKFAVSSGNEVLHTDWVQYRRGIFQGDSLSPLLFCISLLPLSLELRKGNGYKCGPPGRRRHKVTHLFYMDDLKLFAFNQSELRNALDTVHSYSTAVGMKLGLDKCAVLHIKRGRGVGDGADVQLVDGSIIRHLDAGETYKFLGIAESRLQDASNVKKSLRSKYKALLRQIWSSQLSGLNKICATNMLAVPVISYSFGVLKWNINELQALDIETRKIMNIHRSLHKKSSLQRIYLPRHLGGRGLLNLECLHDRIVLGTCIRALRSEDPLLQLVTDHEFAGKGAFLFQAARKAADNLGLTDLAPNRRFAGIPLSNEEYRQISESIKKAEQHKLMEEHMSKHLHSVFFQVMRDQSLSRDLTFAFLRSAGLRSEVEGFIFACQDGVISTLAYRKNILQENIVYTCRACKQRPETLTHLLSGCPFYAVSYYIYRHNAALRVIYYYLRQYYGIDNSPVVPNAPRDVEEVVENSRCRIYWNYTIPTPRPLQATKPDIVLLDHGTREIFVIEFSCPAEKNISSKEIEKREKYSDLLSELRQMYPEHSVKLVVLIMGVLGGVKASFEQELKAIPACRPASNTLVCRVQKACLLGSLRTLKTHGVVH